MPANFFIKSGKIIGRSHLLSGKNCQDALRTTTLDIQDRSFQFAWIADGCSEGRYSETGANLATEFLINQTAKYLQIDIDLDYISLFLYDDLLKFLRINLQSFSFQNELQRVDYIKNHLLFTLIGFIIGPEESLVMAFGDGVVLINDDQIFRNFNDESPYPAYHLIDGRYLNPNRRKIESEFDIYPIRTADLQKLAIGSDAWIQEPDLLSQIWGHPHPNQIQRNLNLWSDRDRRLSDDATLVVAERINS